MSLYDVADKYTEYINEIDSHYSPIEYDKYILTMDGSSHDAHQHDILLKLIDVRIITNVMPEALIKTEIDPSIHRPLMQRLTMTKYKIKATVPKKSNCKNFRDQKFMSIFHSRVNGKVLSGHPIVTSTGNTLRVISYVKYLEKKI